MYQCGAHREYEYSALLANEREETYAFCTWYIVCLSTELGEAIKTFCPFPTSND